MQGRTIRVMARSTPGRKISRPAQGKNEYASTGSRRRQMPAPSVRTSVHGRPAKRVF
jgi:hypothetical protein